MSKYQTNRKLHVLYGGFSEMWKYGWIDHRLVDVVGGYYQTKYPNKTIYVISPTWHAYKDYKEHIQLVGADVVVVCTLSDPLEIDADMIAQLSINDNCIVHQAGHVPTPRDDLLLTISASALACALYFKTYTEDELLPAQFDYVFLNYNRKPHPHRIQLVNELERLNIIDRGIVTLGGDQFSSKYTVNDKNDDYVSWGSNEVGGEIGIPNDIWSLGQLELWNRSFVNVVSETQMSLDPGQTFLTEKVWKPIIGMRPFIVNGSPTIYNWLKDRGFDCFDDLFPVDQLIAQTDVNEIPKIIGSSLAQLVGQDLDQLYKKIFPRLLKNRLRFFEYVTYELEKLSLYSKCPLTLDSFNQNYKRLLFKQFYDNVKCPGWPDVNTFEELPAHLQQECIELHDYKKCCP